MDRKKDIIHMINGIAGKYSAYEVFSDWVRCGALAISNSCQFFHDRVWQEREREYVDTMKRYTLEERRMLSEMLCLLAETLEHGPCDVLGQIYMESGMGSKASGQFFTPYHLSLLCAKLALPDPDENGMYVINEPACGGGGMIIAVAQALAEKGLNFQRCMRVMAQDMDWKGVYMCYLQLSLLGVDGIVVQGDTLCEPFAQGYPPGRILYTPMARRILA